MDATKLHRIFVEYSDEPFIIDGATGRIMSYAEVGAQSAVLARRLAERGVTRGDRVLLWCGNQVEFTIATFAFFRVGAVGIPLSKRLSADDLNYIVGLTEPRLLARVGADAPEFTTPPVLEVRSADLAADVGRFSTAEPFALGPEDSAVILFTSGTTGRPKGVVLQLQALLANFLEYGTALGFGRKTRFIQSLPVQNADGWHFTGLLPFLFGGGVVLTAPFDLQVATRFDQLITKYGGNVLIAVPSILNALMDIRYRLGQPESLRLDYALCSSSRLHSTLRAKFENAFRTKVLEFYGLTETLLIAYETLASQPTPGSVGAVAAQCTVRIDVDGEIWARSPFMFKEYYKDPERTAVQYDGTWFRTGDVGRLDDLNRLILVGRKNEVIRKENDIYSLAEIEEAAVRIPSVKEAAALVDERAGLRAISLFVVLAEASEASVDSVSHALRQALAPTRQPDHLVAVRHIPRNLGGKPDRIRLLGQAAVVVQ